MTSEPVTLTDFEYRGHGLYRWRSSNGNRYATRDMFVASLAKIAADKQTRVIIDSYPGFYYREAFSILETT